MGIKERIETLLRSTERAGIEDLLAWMDQNGFYDMPCSSKYHLAKAGGLAEHSLNVFNAALSMLEAFYEKQGEPLSYDLFNNAIICSLLHDLGKTGQFGKSNYIENNELPFPEFQTNKDLLYIPHEVRSIAIASKFIELTEEEQFAILHHNGLYSELAKSLMNNERPLQMILHFADLWASRVIEN